ncbi:MAG: hypothetical protein HY744_20750 [Deltaproteobacteria bacterium]|nr:hypothetical protein [Deltaproteobacteria bacterium]
MLVARWDLDKTYLRTDFDTLRDLVRTAIERPDQKRTVPGAAALMRELGDAGAAVHIVSGSPESLRGRIVAKLELDCVRWASLTLKPNLQNLLRGRLRALRGQVAYKLRALLRARAEMPAEIDPQGEPVREVLLGDDAEQDALVYSLYADVCAGSLPPERLAAVMRRARAYEDEIEEALRLVSYIRKDPVVGRILIHLDRQSAPGAFARYGARVVPFYNYLQAAFVLFEDGGLRARAVLRVARALVTQHHFAGDALGQSYLDLARRGHVSGRGMGELGEGFAELVRGRRASPPGWSELGEMLRRIEAGRAELRPRAPERPFPIDYLRLVETRRRARGSQR